MNNTKSVNRFSESSRPRIVRDIVTNVAVAVVVAIILSLPVRRIIVAFSPLPTGTILAWNGEGELPRGWQVCDGEHGTPNLSGLFLKGVTDRSEAVKPGQSPRGEDAKCVSQILMPGKGGDAITV